MKKIIKMLVVIGFTIKVITDISWANDTNIDTRTSSNILREFKSEKFDDYSVDRLSKVSDLTLDRCIISYYLDDNKSLHLSIRVPNFQETIVFPSGKYPLIPYYYQKFNDQSIVNVFNNNNDYILKYHKEDITIKDLPLLSYYKQHERIDTNIIIKTNKDLSKINHLTLKVQKHLKGTFNQLFWSYLYTPWTTFVNYHPEWKEPLPLVDIVCESFIEKNL